MSRPGGHDRARLGAYAIGALDPTEARVVHEHLASCPDCQREVNELMTIRRALDQVPPEAFVDGPPEEGDLLLQRTLRQVRAEAPAPRRRVTATVGVAAAAVAIGLAGGVLLGRGTAPTTTAGPPPSTATSTPANARVAEATDSDTGAGMRVALEPKKGWVWVHARATGLPVDAECELYVIPRDGAPVLAGSWLVSEESTRTGTRMEAMALVAPSDVEAVQIRTRTGRTMVTVPM